jgi:hypothetical protein
MIHTSNIDITRTFALSQACSELINNKNKRAAKCKTCQNTTLPSTDLIVVLFAVGSSSMCYLPLTLQSQYHHFD